MGKVLRREGLGAGAGFLQKAEAARLECSVELDYYKIKKPPIGGFLIYLLLIFHFP
ncbi:hypothetical protein [Bacillus cereus]|uniref:hypothetical protein n=1 Tax=Bacillus cereus TaxID=1396 RepID=UPI001585EB67|nr:hypothetical protein [Bacillus cereus]MCR2011350.1 hypothetical protein [Bacillus cereus]MDN4099726.1 hypothetical protein [Bacillus cereus]HDR8187271.1 hypothetical protein [Bacillus cereus]